MLACWGYLLYGCHKCYGRWMLTIEYRPVDELVTDGRNAKKHDPDAIAASIRRHGMVDPIIVDDRTGMIVSGHGRLEVLLAWDGAMAPEGTKVIDGRLCVPVVMGWGSQDDAQAAALLVGLNRTVELGGWDDTALAELLNDLPELDLEATGFGDDDMRDLLRRAGIFKEEPKRKFTERSAADVVTEPGNLWLLGDHRLICGDSTNKATVERLMNGEKALLIATDPPYAVDYEGSDRPPIKGVGHDNPVWLDYVESDVDLFTRYLEVAREVVLAPHAAVYQWYGDRQVCAVRQGWLDNGLLAHQNIIWHKKSPVMARVQFMYAHESCLYGWVQGSKPTRRPPNNERTVWEVDDEQDRDPGHPTSKPVDLFARTMRWHLARGEIAYEPFCGSGGALIAAEREDRRCYAIEMAPAFVDLTCARWQEETGQMPVLESTGLPYDFSIT